MPGVLRPYTLADVLGTIVQQSTATSTSVGVPTAVFGEIDEAAAMADSWTPTVQPNPGWDGGVWGASTWQ